MKKITTIIAGLLLSAISLNTFALRPATTDNAASLAPVLKNAMPAVVNILSRGEIPILDLPIFNKQNALRNNFASNPKFQDVGSGVIVDAENGYILTNAHVIKDAKSITVTLHDNRSTIAKVIGSDNSSDIAVIQIHAKHLQKLNFADSDKLKVGDFVCAIGSPFGLQQAVSSGIVSGLERNNLGIESLENFIQTDAPINPGNSGGALIDMQGELVGINTAIIAPAPGNAGVGLAIPSNMAKSVMEQLIKYGKVKRGIMGVMVQDITPALAEALHLPNTEGALVTNVIGGTPAAKAGLRNRDVIVKIMNKPVHSASQISNTVSLVRTDSEVSMQVRRGDRIVDLKSSVVDPEDLKKAAENAPKILLAGLQLKNFSQLVDNEQIKGVEVLSVDDTSVGFSSNLRPGDVIIAAADQKVTTIEELQKIAEQHPKQLLLEIKRGLKGSALLVLEE